MQEFAHEYARQLFLHPDEFAKESGLWCLRMGQNIAKANYQVGPKRIECYSLHFLVEGQMLLQYENREVILQSGDICCFFPNEPYSYRIYKPDQSMKLIWIAFQGPQAGRLLQKLGLSQGSPYLRAKCTKEVHDQLLATLTYGFGLMDKALQIDCTLELQAKLYSLFAKLVKAGQASENPEAAPIPWLERSIDFIRLHYAEGISIREIAEAAGVHRSYFSDVFKNKLGISPNRYVYRLKMEKAAALIAEGGRSITEIAHTVGYPSLYSFSRAYRQYFGYSPTVKRTFL